MQHVDGVMEAARFALNVRGCVMPTCCEPYDTSHTFFLRRTHGTLSTFRVVVTPTIYQYITYAQRHPVINRARGLPSHHKHSSFPAPRSTLLYSVPPQRAARPEQTAHSSIAIERPTSASSSEDP